MENLKENIEKQADEVEIIHSYVQSQADTRKRRHSSEKRRHNPAATSRSRHESSSERGKQTSHSIESRHETSEEKRKRHKEMEKDKEKYRAREKKKYDEMINRRKRHEELKWKEHDKRELERNKRNEEKKKLEEQRKKLKEVRNSLVGQIAGKFKDRSDKDRTAKNRPSKAKMQENKETLKRTIAAAYSPGVTFGKALPPSPPAGLQKYDKLLAQMILKKKELHARYNASKMMRDFEEYVLFQKSTAKFATKKRLSDRESEELSEILGISVQDENVMMGSQQGIEVVFFNTKYLIFYFL